MEPTVSEHNVDSFGAKGTLEVGDTSYEVFRLSAVEGSQRLPFSLKILLENLLRNEDGANITAAQIRALATTFLATYRAAYAAERSTFDGSFPLNAPPPWRAIPPYVSTTILRPVNPQSPIGPPITNRPVGFTKKLRRNSRGSYNPSGNTGTSTCSQRSSRITDSAPS